MCYINKLTNRQETMKCLRDKHIYNHTYITYIQTNIHYITCIATLRQLKSKWPVKPVGVDTVKYVAITVNYWTPNDILCVGKLHKICLLDCGIFGFFTFFFFNKVTCENFVAYPNQRDHHFPYEFVEKKNN